MIKEAYLGLDIGGTGVKAGVFGHDGKMLAFSRRAFEPKISPEGHVDIPIDVIYDSARNAVREAVRKSRSKILAMAVSSQGETFVSLDKHDRPLHDAIVWYDSRSKVQADELRRAVPSAADRIDPHYSVCKIRWLQNNRPVIMQRAKRFLLLPDYFSWRLAGRPATDPTIAGSGGMTNSEGDGYDKEILKAAGIEVDQLAKIMPAGSPIGYVRKAVAKEWELSPETLLVVGTNDQYAGALGAGNCRPGILSVTFGTCLAMVTLAKSKPRKIPPGLMSGKFPIPGFWFILAYAKTSGVVLDWFRRECAGNMDWPTLNRAAAHIPAGCNGLTMVPHFDGLISPEPNENIRGAFLGLTLQHTTAAMYRAVLEGLTFSLRENMELIEKIGFKIRAMRAIGGGAKNDFWLRMQADVLGRPVEKPAVTEAAVLGAAMLAATGRGTYGSLAEAGQNLYRVGRIFKPDPKGRQAYHIPYERYLRLTAREAASAPEHKNQRRIQSCVN